MENFEERVSLVSRLIDIKGGMLLECCEIHNDRTPLLQPPEMGQSL